MKRCAWSLLLIILAGGGLPGQKAVDRDAVLADPEWRQVYDDCQPDPALLASLRERIRGARVEVYFAFWCGDSRNHVPVFRKIVDLLDAPDLTIEYAEVERKASPEQKFYVADKDVERVPTFIVTRDGSEIGRIIENPKASILEDLLDILL
jgi:thiol-disulfide isomerase/thioredoxin